MTLKSSLLLLSVVTLIALSVVGLATFNSYGDEAVSGIAQDSAVMRVAATIHDDQREHGQAESRFVPSKPMSVVHFVKPERYLASIGETLTVNMTVMVSASVESFTVKVRAEQGAVISDRQLVFGALVAGEERKVSFDVTVLAQGRHYINVVATAQTLDGVRQSTYSVPIEVGDPQVAAKRRRTVTDDQGNTLLLMPAKTTKGGEQPR